MYSWHFYKYFSLSVELRYGITFAHVNITNLYLHWKNVESVSPVTKISAVHLERAISEFHSNLNMLCGESNEFSDEVEDRVSTSVNRVNSCEKWGVAPFYWDRFSADVKFAIFNFQWTRLLLFRWIITLYLRRTDVCN